MYKDITDTISKIANIDPNNFHHKCEDCNEKEDIGVIIYEKDEYFQTVFDDNIQFLKNISQTISKYVCHDCFLEISNSDNCETCFYFDDLLQLESLETLRDQVFQKRLNIHKDLFENKIVYPRFYYCISEINNYTIIENSFIYQGDEGFENYFLKLSKSEKNVFDNYGINEKNLKDILSKRNVYYGT